MRILQKRTLSEITHGADVFVGLSAGNLVTPAMLQNMNARPIIFALANPTPEISYEEAKLARPDAIVATGRSDFPNQVNNVLAFPLFFEVPSILVLVQLLPEMKIAASYAIANLAKERTPETLRHAYGHANFSFGPEYILPKPFDPRVLLAVAPAVAQAATDCGVARLPIKNFLDYKDSLARRLNPRGVR